MATVAETDDPTLALADLAADHRRRPVLLAMDFDGTLSPLRDDPEHSAPLPQAAAGMASLVGTPWLHLALVSGRMLEELAERAAPPVGTMLVGSHGAERGVITPGGLVRSPFSLTADRATRLREAELGLERIASGVPGSRVERKASAVVLHTRLCPVDPRPAVEAAVDLAARLGISPLLGKDVVELPVVAVTKGDAVQSLREELGAAAVIFVGDDVTDEHAMEVLGPEDLGIRVGPGRSAARYRVDSPAEVGALLVDFAAAVAAATI